MAAPIRILSTKVLTPPQRERLLHAGFAVVEKSFVTTPALEFESPGQVERAIITSANAVPPVREKELHFKHCFCVGEKTRAALVKAGYHPELCTSTAEELAKALVLKYKGKHFHFFGTRSRRNELPDIFSKNNTPLTEIYVYETVLNPGAINGSFDGILFFSPSAIASFFQDNTIAEAKAFCIGPTTAGELQAPGTQVITAKKPTAEHLILETITYFKTHKDYNLEPRI